METTIIKPKGLEIPNPTNSTTRQTIPTSPEGVKKYINILPRPVGYRMLIRPWSGEKKTKGGIILSDTTHEMIEMTTVVGLVIMMGDLCYKDTKKFHNKNRNINNRRAYWTNTSFYSKKRKRIYEFITSFIK